MKNFNNLYNFKNPIRHFFNLDKIRFDNSESCAFEDLSWTAPVKFKIFKTEDSQRTISFPNILNYYHTVKCFETEENFYSINKMSDKKRVSPDLDVGEFSVLSYYKSVQMDAFNLTKFDKLLIMDIKSFYGRIYTHDFGFKNDKYLEQRAGSLNAGRTNGLLLGSYLSLYLAEKYLKKIEDELDSELDRQNIKCHYEYFSDDFYFFCHNSDIDKIKSIFSKILDAYELQVNYDKTVIFDFEEYTRDNNLEKLWKKIIKESQSRDELIKKQRKIKDTYVGHPFFFTQLVYRLSQISELKYKRIFLSNFFKTYYFDNLKPKIYQLSESDLNNICYIYKLMPETMLYSLTTIKQMAGFNLKTFKEFVLARFDSVLHSEKYEEQVYFYYAIKVCGLDQELYAFKDLVLKSKNQILISYFVIDKIINKADYATFVTHPKENEWLQNYHYILVNDKSMIDMLIPENAKKDKQKSSYREFYKLNIDNNTPIMKPIKKVTEDIKKFIEAKIASYSR